MKTSSIFSLSFPSSFCDAHISLALRSRFRVLCLSPLSITTSRWRSKPVRCVAQCRAAPRRAAPHRVHRSPLYRSCLFSKQ
jgi:hypothetical protein